MRVETFKHPTELCQSKGCPQGVSTYSETIILKPSALKRTCVNDVSFLRFHQPPVLFITLIPNSNHDYLIYLITMTRPWSFHFPHIPVVTPNLYRPNLRKHVRHRTNCPSRHTADPFGSRSWLLDNQHGMLRLMIRNGNTGRFAPVLAIQIGEDQDIQRLYFHSSPQHATHRHRGENSWYPSHHCLWWWGQWWAPSTFNKGINGTNRRWQWQL